MALSNHSLIRRRNTQNAPQTAALLGSGAPDERTRAYVALEAVDDVALAVASVAPLTAVFARSAEEC